MTDRGFTHDAFLSHRGKDRAVAHPLAERSQNDGLKVWFDEWKLPVAAPRESAADLSDGQRHQKEVGGALTRRRYAEMIEEGLEHSRVLVLCMSANAFGSDWAQLQPTISQLSTINPHPTGAPLNQGSAASFPYFSVQPSAFSLSPPPLSKAFWPNSFTSTGARWTASSNGRKPERSLSKESAA